MILMKTGWVASFAATISTAAVLALGPRAAVAQGLKSHRRGEDCGQVRC